MLAAWSPPPPSEDETFVVILSSSVWLASWLLWYRGLAVGPRLRREGAPRTVLAAAPVLALALVLAILLVWSSHDVRGSSAYLYQYLALGGAWVGVALALFRWLGVSARDDVGERGNLAAAVGLGGAAIGAGLCYAGGNIGDGPGWWVVVFSSGLATAAFFVLWAVLEKAAHPSDAITIDRDLAAGLRLAAFCVALGLLLGRAVAGDWESGAATLRDLAVDGWPALVLLPAAIGLERALAPSERGPRSPLLHGAFPGALYVLAALSWVAVRGAWS